MGIELLPYDPSDLLRQRDIFLQSEEYTRRLPAKSSPVGRLQYVIRFLNYIFRSGGRASIADISKHQDMVRYGSRAWHNPKARIGQYIWLTENLGLLEKTDDLVLLTEAGKELMHKGEPLDMELRDFTDEQKRFLCHYILSYTNRTPPYERYNSLCLGP